jgi:hypothetical protein
VTPVRKLLAVCVVIEAGLYIAYRLIFPTVYLRYRLTLDVDVDGVTRTGSGVVEIAYQPVPMFMNIGQGSHFGGEMRGHAITVDLGARGLLFVVDSRPFLTDPKTGLAALPEAATLSMLPFAGYGLSQDQGPSTGLAHARELREKKGRVEIPPEMLPMMVRFKDINDRGAIEELDPRDFAAVYGRGVQLAGARFEFTATGVTPMPQSWPNWLVDEREREFFFLHQNPPPYGSIWTYAFKGR